jgi:hypothetical protein
MRRERLAERRRENQAKTADIQPQSVEHI